MPGANGCMEILFWILLYKDCFYQIVLLEDGLWENLICIYEWVPRSSRPRMSEFRIEVRATHYHGL